MVVRAESETPPVSIKSLPMVRRSPIVVFYGVTEELHYTSPAQRGKLDKYSRPELDPSEQTTAVLIPVAKSPEWWHLTQDERQAYFQQTRTSQGHTTIGLPYVDRIYRRLYHSRHLPKPSKYDFLTYFEFRDADAPAFRELLAKLRDVKRNPEWRYVNREFEVWMTKLA
jgi:chlorite dismutase